MARPLPEPLRQPVTDLESAKAWVRALVDADLDFHLEDDPADQVVIQTGERVFRDEDVPAVNAAVAACYEVEDWGKFGCPIGFMMAYHARKYGDISIFHERDDPVFGGKEEV